MSEKPYLIETVQVRKHNPDYNQEARCKCGHPYYRHFDTYDDMEPVGCKYCMCHEFQEAAPRKLKSIEEHNDERLYKAEVRHSTGVACPNCGDELTESSPGVVLTSNPPQKSVICYRCNYRTNIYA